MSDNTKVLDAENAYKNFNDAQQLEKYNQEYEKYKPKTLNPLYNEADFKKGYENMGKYADQMYNISANNIKNAQKTDITQTNKRFAKTRAALDTSYGKTTRANEEQLSSLGLGRGITKAPTSGYGETSRVSAANNYGNNLAQTYQDENSEIASLKKEYADRLAQSEINRAQNKSNIEAQRLAHLDTANQTQLSYDSLNSSHNQAWFNMLFGKVSEDKNLLRSDWRDAKSDNQFDRQFNEGVRQYEKNFAEQKRQYDQNYELSKEELALARQKASGSSGGSYGGGLGGSYTPEEQNQDGEENIVENPNYIVTLDDGRQVPAIKVTYTMDGKKVYLYDGSVIEIND